MNAQHKSSTAKAGHNDDSGAFGHNIKQNFSEIRNDLHCRFKSDVKEDIFDDGNISKLNFSPKVGSGYFEFLDFGDGLSFILADAQFNETQTFNFWGEDWLRFHFRICLENTLVFNKKTKFDLDGPLAELLLLPAEFEVEDHFVKNEKIRFISIFCKRTTITNILGFDLGVLPRQIQSYASGETVEFLIKHSRYSHEIYMALSVLFDINVPGTFRHLFIRAKILEILCLYISELNGTLSTPISLNNRERDRILDIATAIENNPAQACSIRDFVRMAGLNRNKLTQGFKELFGVSVFEFHREKRMALAWHMLREKRQNISEIAYTTGYAHQSTFSAAFYKQFGVKPSQIYMNGI